ncbi:MAG: thiamine pyrophosphate-dependent enzyme [Elusimicrobiaceae bacterium]|nr:thiamine pyrophosphate-dependent enzyme [Elusimicrobiaceae bacterium]
MKKMLLLGDEAVGQAAADAGLGGAFGYPGTPSTEIFEYLEKHASEYGYSAIWSGNEKVAFEEALGMSYVGKRAIVTMKHVGLNVAADPFVCSGVIGAHGGLIAAVADDPGMHSSQDEQDSRYYASFAKVPCYEPATQQQAYDMTREAFKLSEDFETPVLMRLVTRIAHSRAVVACQPPDENNGLGIADDPDKWVILPAHARRLYPAALNRYRRLGEYAENCRWNKIQPAANPADKTKGIIVCGTGHNYIMEAFEILGIAVDVLRLGFHPIPPKLLAKFLEGKSEVMLFEDGYPFVEERINGLAGAGPAVRGRLDGFIGETGELDPDRAIDCVARFLNAAKPQTKQVSVTIPARPPKLCPGCPHIDTFTALNDALETRQPARVFSDIGCYTLGALPPLNAINSCVEMGASVGMAKGAAQGGLKYPVAVLGDGTFEHSGLTSLLGAARENTPMTLIILDNGTTAMTGAQDSLANGAKLHSVVAGLGVDPAHLKKISPLPAKRGENAALIGAELDYAGLSVIIAERECIQIIGKRRTA